MNKYVVISPFKDEKDKNYVYDVGKKYPRDGINIDEERIQELITDKNKTGHPLIRQVWEEQSVSFEEEKKKIQKQILEKQNQKIQKQILEKQSQKIQKQIPEKIIQRNLKNR